jgi:capsular polysaccharide biosynthesis protein
MNAIPVFQDTALPESYSLVRQLFRNSCAPNIDPNLRIYVRRDRSHLTKPVRTFINEEDVSLCMEFCGFRIVDMETLSVREQIRLFSEAAVIVSAHGAALAYSVFCGAGAKIVEIYRPNAAEKRHFMHIAACLGLGFTRFTDVAVCDADENMNVNVHALHRLVQDLIS